MTEPPAATRSEASPSEAWLEWGWFSATTAALESSHPPAPPEKEPSGARKYCAGSAQRRNGRSSCSASHDAALYAAKRGGRNRTARAGEQGAARFAR